MSFYLVGFSPGWDAPQVPQHLCSKLLPTHIAEIIAKGSGLPSKCLPKKNFVADLSKGQ
jgi:hypothetical protein